jgi:uncharacterized protein
MNLRRRAMLREEMTWDKLRPVYVQIYQESFTQEEIDGLIAFYESPAGFAFVEKMPFVMQKSMSIMQSRSPRPRSRQLVVNPSIERMHNARPF